jgi:dolichyl-phosphate-mannose--protein O-mannosyl transferase
LVPIVQRESTQRTQNRLLRCVRLVCALLQLLLFARRLFRWAKSAAACFAVIEIIAHCVIQTIRSRAVNIFAQTARGAKTQLMNHAPSHFVFAFPCALMYVFHVCTTGRVVGVRYDRMLERNTIRCSGHLTQNHLCVSS